MRTQKQILRRLFYFQTASLIVCLIWLLSLASLTNMIIQKEAYYNDPFYGGNFELNLTSFDLPDVQKTREQEIKEFYESPVSVPKYYYLFFALACLFWLYWADYVYYLYCEVRD